VPFDWLGSVKAVASASGELLEGHQWFSVLDNDSIFWKLHGPTFISPGPIDPDIKIKTISAIPTRSVARIFPNATNYAVIC
jgi:hypothetical protein